MANIAKIELGDGQIFDIEDAYSRSQISDHSTRLGSAETKLSTIAAGAEVNQNAFSNVNVRGDYTSTLAAISKTDTLNLSFANHIRMIPVASDRSLQIMTDIEAASNYTEGLMSASDKIKLDGISTRANNVRLTSKTMALLSTGNIMVSAGSFATLSCTTSLEDSYVFVGVTGVVLKSDSDTYAEVVVSSWEYNGLGSLKLRVYNPTSSPVAISKSASSVTILFATVS